MIGFDDWKTNKFRIFIRVFSVREWYVEKGVTLWRIKDLDPNSCYYLGQYPWHWDYEFGSPLPPGPGMIAWTRPTEIRKLISEAPKEKWTGPQRGPYEGTPGIPGVTGVTLENLSEEEMIFYHGKLKYANYLSQMSFQEWLNTRLKNCIAQKYPPPGWKPKVRVREAGTDMDWPGEPIRSLDPPIPMGRRALPPGVEQTTTSVTMALYFSPPDREDGMTLDLEIT